MQRCFAEYILFIQFGTVLEQDSNDIYLLRASVVNGIEQGSFASRVFLVNDIGSLEKDLKTLIVSTTSNIVNGSTHLVILDNNFCLFTNQNLTDQLISTIVQRSFEFSVSGIDWTSLINQIFSQHIITLLGSDMQAAPLEIVHNTEQLLLVFA
jgi:hypothetical protein